MSAQIGGVKAQLMARFDKMAEQNIFESFQKWLDEMVESGASIESKEYDPDGYIEVYGKPVKIKVWIVADLPLRADSFEPVFDAEKKMQVEQLSSAYEQGRSSCVYLVWC